MRYLDTLCRVGTLGTLSTYTFTMHGTPGSAGRPARGASRAPCDRAVTAIEFRPRSTRRRAVGLIAGTIPKRRARGPDRRPGFPPAAAFGWSSRFGAARGGGPSKRLLTPSRHRSGRRRGAQPGEMLRALCLAMSPSRRGRAADGLRAVENLCVDAVLRESAQPVFGAGWACVPMSRAVDGRLGKDRRIPTDVGRGKRLPANYTSTHLRIRDASYCW